MNPFENIITSEHKKIYNQAIDALLAESGITVSCKFVYVSQPDTNSMLCNNCIFDSIIKLSSNIYNGSGPVPFDNAAVCPVCLGAGFTKQEDKDNIYEESIYLGVISDSKFFIKSGSQTINIPDGSIQTYCSINLLPKIRNASYLIVDPSLEKYGNYAYERNGDPDPTGFGDNNYILTMWKRK